MSSETSGMEVLDKLTTEQLLNETESELSPLQRHWAKVAGVAADLDPQAAAYDDQVRKANPAHRNSFMLTSTKAVWLTSIRNPTKGTISGRVTQAPPWLAAQYIVAETHRPSKPEEIEAWKKEQEKRKEAATKLATERNPQPVPHIVVNLPAESVQSIRDAARQSGQKQQSETKQ